MEQLVVKAPLWATVEEDDDNLLPLPKAVLLALLFELLILALLIINWRELLGKAEPPPMKVEFVKVTPPPKEAPAPPQSLPEPEVKPEPPPPPPPPKREKKIVEAEKPKPIEKPRPLPEVKPEPKPIPEPPPVAQPQPEPEPTPPEQVAEPAPEPPPVPAPREAPPPQAVREVPQAAPVEASPSPPEPPRQQRSGKPVYKVRAAYPKSALREGVEGRVKVRITVSEHGTVADVEILEATPPGIFDNSVLDAVKQYKFEPGSGSMTVNQVIVFKIEE